MFWTTVIPTIGRPSLETAVNSVLNQKSIDFDFEVVVVNDSGRPLPEGSWQQSARVRVIETNKHNRSVARNTGAAVAKGRFLHFLDDDDWMFPDAFSSLSQLSDATNAAWLFGGFRLVDNAGATIADIYPDETGNCSIQLIAWEWLPLQASLIASEAFFSVGGFASLGSLLGGFEDVDLSRQVSLRYDAAGVHKLVTTIRAGEVGSTTDYLGMFKQNRQSREKSLAHPGAFRRLRASADSSRESSYWCGKVIYYYLASMKWNAQRGYFTTALSRCLYSTIGVLLSANRLCSKSFWRGVVNPHYPRMGTAIEAANAGHLYAETRRKIESASGFK